ncbi:Malate dehydrogenase (NADP(+)) [Methanococcus vannielii SB]|jgi:malate dehydrogenase|uniref:Malate dehydrogenase (NADP(+)) n=1 Tax=Methanococcus vannielii (strain ATCC 35089 / DSM 1224 / JCM 13029 / OCM 148 / SB) TaxID=406327 RepID=A6USG8_METVS|nr:malate dehydrogenase [Methanococcus vannielii]ABR55440.1 Malate dehydrogenase (NADP(+)) [Methanococcus vannielii SB]
MDIAIIGASGKIGSALSLLLSKEPYIKHIKLIGRDNSINKLKGLKMDLYDSMAASGQDTDIQVFSDSEMSCVNGSDITVITSGISRNGEISRLDLAKENAKIVKKYVKDISKCCDTKLFMITNPVDVMTYKAYIESGYEKNQVFGLGTHLDSMRFKVAVAKYFKVHIDDVRTRIVGEHGDSMVPLMSATSIGGIPARRLPGYENFPYYETLERIRGYGKEIIDLKNGSEYGPASAILNIIRCISQDEKRLLTLSAYVEDEIEGISGGSCIGVPVKVGKNGIEEVIHMKMKQGEFELFRESFEIVKKYCKEIETI